MLAKTDENYKSIDLDYAKALDMFRFFHPLDVTSLPPEEALYAKLKQKGITEEEYERAKKCWNDAGFETKAIYLLVYLKIKVL